MRYLIALITIVSALVVSGCPGDDNGDEPAPVNVTAANLTNRSFFFESGEVFGIDPGAGDVVLTFGSFSGNSGPFRLEAGAVTASATGEATLSSCVLRPNIGNFRAGQGPQAGTPITLDVCTIDADGRLHVENRALGQTATANDQHVAEAPPAGIGRLVTPSRSTSIALTADDRSVVVANRDTNSVAFIAVRSPEGQDVAAKIVELARLS